MDGHVGESRVSLPGLRERDTRLNVHHNTYDRYGDESAFDLIALCGGCHELFHGIVEDAS